MISKEELFKYNVLWWSVIIVCLLLLICSCGSSKNIDLNKQTDYSGAFRQIQSRMDSLLFNMDIQRRETSEKLSNLKVENKTVYYSIPDSTGKQYPVKESTTNINKEEQECRQVDETLLISMQYLSARMDSLNDKINALTNEKEKVTELSWWDLYKDKVYCGIIVLLIVGWLVYKLMGKL